MQHDASIGLLRRKRPGVWTLLLGTLFSRPLAAILGRIVSTAAGRNLIRREIHYRLKAHQHGIEFLGVFERHRIALFQDPVTGSSFAVREHEPVEAGIRRVRLKFGLPR